MLVINLAGIALSYGTREIIKDLTFRGEYGDKVGIVGVNGAGKTSLLKIISGEIKPDKGDIFISKNIEIGYLKQEDDTISNLSIYDAVLDIYKSMIIMENQLSEMEKSISIEKNNEKIENLMSKYASLRDIFERNGGYEYKGRVKGILRGLGFDDEEFELKVSTLSGGQRTRLMMARLLSKEPDILLLDEPTNHLDMKAVSWLEGFVKDYKKTCFIVSHDRYFLDKVCTGIFEIENASGFYYKGNYTNYCSRKELDRANQQTKFDIQQKEINRLNDFVEKQRQWNRERNIIAAESRLKAIDRIEKVDLPSKSPQKINFTIKQAKKSGNDVLSVKNLEAGYDNKVVFENISFDLKRKDRAFIIGSNGCGKSTLLKVITSKIKQNSGQIDFGHNVVYSYYDQAFSELNTKSTPYDEVLEMDNVLSQTEIRSILAAFGFIGDDVFKKIEFLSGGEKSRVLLTKTIVSLANMIIMDEPTNHLDINSREVLEEKLSDFDGTILCVSHDRYFIKKLATRIIDLDQKEIIDFKGNYEDYLEFLKKRNDYSKNNDKIDTASISKDEYFASKEQKAIERKNKRNLEDTESKIDQKEKKLKDINKEMEKVQLTTNHELLNCLFQEKELLETELKALIEYWESILT